MLRTCLCYGETQHRQVLPAADTAFSKASVLCADSGRACPECVPLLLPFPSRRTSFL